MPYSDERLPIANKKYDRRVKLQPEHIRRIKGMFREGYAIRAIARQFGVCPRRIQFIIYPERLERCLAHRRARGGSAYYYDRKKHANYMRRHRRYKHALFLRGKLQRNPTKRNFTSFAEVMS